MFQLRHLHRTDVPGKGRPHLRPHSRFPQTDVMNAGGGVGTNAGEFLTVVEHVFDLLSHPSIGVQTAAVRVCGQIAAGNDAQTDYLVHRRGEAFLPLLLRLLESANSTIRKEAFWTASNIAAGTTEQVQ